MATLSVVAFRNASHGNKVHILQENINNTQNIKCDKSDVILVKKEKKILGTLNQNITVANSMSGQNILVQSQAANIAGPKIAKVKESSISRIHNPPPIAVARRNARERNRVKQVNNGFATLRQHIPNEIAEIYENANNNRSANKKLSKVETLRMAVEYIRSLECLLSLDESRDSKENSANLSMASFPSPASSESLQNSSSFEQSYFSVQSPMLEDDEDSNPPTPLPSVINHHYSRIPGTNTFQLIPGPATLHNFEDEENIHPMTPNSDLISQEDILIHPGIIEGNMDFIQAGGQEFAVIHPNMLSPDFYSENSLSPHQDVESLDMKYVTTININGQQALYPQSLLLAHPQTMILSADVPSNKLQRNLSAKNVICKDTIISTPGLMNQKVIFSDLGLKQEIDDVDENFQNEVIVNPNMEDVMSWWESEKKNEDRS